MVNFISRKKTVKKWTMMVIIVNIKTNGWNVKKLQSTGFLQLPYFIQAKTPSILRYTIILSTFKKKILLNYDMPLMVGSNWYQRFLTHIKSTLESRKYVIRCRK